MFKTTHLAVLTIPLAAVLAWPGQVPLMLSIPVILTAIATIGLGAMATLRECWTSLVGDVNQKMLLRLRWAVWLRQPADCSVLAEAIVERTGLTFDPNDAGERANLVGLMFNLRRLNARHAGAIGTPLTSHELARQLWAVAPGWAQDRDGWLMLAAAAHTQASLVDMPQGPVGRVLRIRNEIIGTLFWRRRHERLNEIFVRAGSWEKPAIPMEELSPFLLAAENDVQGALLHSAITSALLENDLDPRNDGISALPLAIQARLVALLLLLEAKPGKGHKRAWLIASGKLPQLLALRDLAYQAEDLDLDALNETAFEGPAAAEGLFETFATRAKQAAGEPEQRRYINVPDADRDYDVPPAEEERGFGWGAKVTSLEDVRATRAPVFTPSAEQEPAEEEFARRAAPTGGPIPRPASALAVAEAYDFEDLDDLESSLDDMLNIAPQPTAATPATGPAPALKPVPGGRTSALFGGAPGPVADAAPKPQAPAPRRVARQPEADTADSIALKDAARAAAEALRRTAPRPAAPVSPAPETPQATPAPEATAAPAARDAQDSGPAPALLLRRVWQPGQTVNSPTSQFGGIPNLPAKKPWPRHSERGEPLHFLARLECAALLDKEGTPDILEDMPRKGEILVFADVGAQSGKSASDNRVEVSLMFLSARDLGGAIPAALPADLPDIDHDGGVSITLSDRPGQRIFPKLGLDICSITTDADGEAGQQCTLESIARHLPSNDRAPQRRLFRRVAEADRAEGGGFWQFDETALGDGFPATASIARSVFAAIAANAARARSRMLAHSHLVEEAGLETQADETSRMAWLEALAASADLLRSRLPQKGSEGDTTLCATERARIRAWLAAIAHRNPETGMVAEAAVRDTLRRLAIEAIQSPEAAVSLDGACLRFIAPSLMPTVDEADHRVGGAPLPGSTAPEGYQKFLQLDSDPAIGFRFADGSGEDGRLEIWIPRDGKFGARLRRAEGRIVPA